MSNFLFGNSGPVASNLRNFVSGMSNQPAVSAGQIIPAGLAAKAGQPGRFVANPNPHDNYSSTIHDINDFLDGVAITTQEITERLITEAPEDFIRRIYPLRRSDKIELESSIWELNHAQLPEVPTQGTYRVMSSRRRTKRGRMRRRGIALDTESTSTLTAEGTQQQQRMLAGMTIAVIETAVMDVAWEITHSGHMNLHNARAYAGDEGVISNPLQQARAERAVAFSLHKNPQRFAVLVNTFMKELQTGRGVSGPYALIVPADFLLTFDPSNRKMGAGEGFIPGAEILNRNFQSRAGPVLRFNNGVEAYALPELHTYDRPVSGDVRHEMFQMLARHKVYAEFYQMCFGNRRDQDLYDGITNLNTREKYRTKQRDVVLYNVHIDQYDRISFRIALQLALGSGMNDILTPSYSDHYPTGKKKRAVPWFYARSGGNSYVAKTFGGLDTNVMMKSDLRQIAQTKAAYLAASIPDLADTIRDGTALIRSLGMITENPANADLVDGIPRGQESGPIAPAGYAGYNGVRKLAEWYNSGVDMGYVAAGARASRMMRAVGEISDLLNIDNVFDRAEDNALIFALLFGTSFTIASGEQTIDAQMGASGTVPTISAASVTQAVTENAHLSRIMNSLSRHNMWPETPIGVHLVQDGNVVLVASNDHVAAMKQAPDSSIFLALPAGLARDVAKVANVAEAAGPAGTDAFRSWASNTSTVASTDDAKQAFAMSLVDATGIAGIGARFGAEEANRVVEAIKKQTAIKKKTEVAAIGNTYKEDARRGAPCRENANVAEEMAKIGQALDKPNFLPSSAVATVSSALNAVRDAAKAIAADLPQGHIGYVVLPGVAKAGPTELVSSDIDGGADLTARVPGSRRAEALSSSLDNLHAAMARAGSSVDDRLAGVESVAATSSSSVAAIGADMSLAQARAAVRAGKKVIDPRTGKEYLGLPEHLRFASDMEGAPEDQLTHEGLLNLIGVRKGGRRSARAKPRTERDAAPEDDLLDGVSSIGARIRANEANDRLTVSNLDESGVALELADSNFKSHWEAARRERNPLLRFLMLLTLGDNVSMRNIEWYLNNDIHVPLNVLLFAPFMIYMMDTMSLLKYGSETGNMFYGFPALMQGNDVSNQTTLTTFSIWMRAFTHQEKNIINIPDTRCRMAISGAGTTFFDRSEFTNQIARNTESKTRPSLIAYALPITENEFPDGMSPAGYFSFGDHTEEEYGKYQFSAAQYEAEAPNGWKMYDRFYKTSGWQANAEFGAPAPWPEVAFQGQVVSHNGHGFDTLIKNNAHRGPNSCFAGAASRYNGPDLYFLDDEKVTSTVLTDVAAMVSSY